MRKTLFLIICFCLTNTVFAQDYDVKRIKFISGKNTLHGQISIPKNKKNLPLIVFLPGSGEASYQTNYKKFLGLTIEELFRKDFALLYFDKPGINRSTGEWWNQDFYEQAENAVTAVRYAKKMFSINNSKVGIIGHSQGGWLTQIAASRYPKEISFGISLVGPAVSVLEQFVETENSKYLCEGLDNVAAKEKAVQDSYAEWIRSTKREVTDKNLLHFNVIKGYDPRLDIKNIRIPFLFVFAENDEVVYPTESLDSIANIFGDKMPKNVSTIIMSGVDHSFRLNEKCFKGDKKSLKFSDALNPQIKNWIEQIVQVKPQIK